MQLLKYLFFTVCLISPLTSILAQSSTDAKPVALEFRCVSFNQVSTEPLYYREGDFYHPLNIPLRKYSNTYKYKVNHGFEIYYKTTNELGEEIYKMVGIQKFNPNRKKTLYLIDKPMGESKKLRIFALNDELDSFPKASFRFVNLTKTELIVGFSKSAKRLKSGQIIAIPSSVPESGGMNPMVITDKNEKILRSSKLFVQPNGRMTVFLYPPFYERQRLDLKFLPDRIIPLNKEKIEE